MSRLQSKKEEYIEAILSSMHGCPRDVVSKLIGQVNAIKSILDIYSFLEDEATDDEI